jgi:Transposase IS66 family
MKVGQPSSCSAGIATAPLAATLRNDIRHATVAYSDETSVRVDSHTWWEWVIRRRNAALHSIRFSRGRDVIEEKEHARTAAPTYAIGRQSCERQRSVPLEQRLLLAIDIARKIWYTFSYTRYSIFD